MNTYVITMESGDTMLMDVDLTQASSPIRYCAVPEEYEWAHTGYQTADAGHDPMRAAKLVMRDELDAGDAIASVV